MDEETAQIYRGTPVKAVKRDVKGLLSLQLDSPSQSDVVWNSIESPFKTRTVGGKSKFLKSSNQLTPKNNMGKKKYYSSPVLVARNLDDGKKDEIIDEKDFEKRRAIEEFQRQFNENYVPRNLLDNLCESLEDSIVIPDAEINTNNKNVKKNNHVLDDQDDEFMDEEDLDILKEIEEQEKRLLIEKAREVTPKTIASTSKPNSLKATQELSQMATVIMTPSSSSTSSKSLNQASTSTSGKNLYQLPASTSSKNVNQMVASTSSKNTNQMTLGTSSKNVNHAMAGTSSKNTNQMTLGTSSKNVNHATAGTSSKYVHQAPSKICPKKVPEKVNYFDSDDDDELILSIPIEILTGESSCSKTTIKNNNPPNMKSSIVNNNNKSSVRISHTSVIPAKREHLNVNNGDINRIQNQSNSKPVAHHSNTGSISSNIQNIQEPAAKRVCTSEEIAEKKRLAMVRREAYLRRLKATQKTT